MRERRSLIGRSSASVSTLVANESTYHMLIVRYTSAAAIEEILHVVHESGLKVLRLHAERMESEALDKLTETLGTTFDLHTATRPMRPQSQTKAAAALFVQVADRSCPLPVRYITSP